MSDRGTTLIWAARAPYYTSTSMEDAVQLLTVARARNAFVRLGDVFFNPDFVDRIELGSWKLEGEPPELECVDERLPSLR